MTLGASEPGAVVMRMSPQGVLLVALHMTFMVEQGAQLLLDGLGCALRAGSPESPIVSLTHVPEATEVGSVGSTRRHTLRLLAQQPGVVPLPSFPRRIGLYRSSNIWWVGPPSVALRIGRDQGRFHVFGPPIQPEMTEEGAHNTPWRDATVSGIDGPRFEVARLQSSAPQAEKAVRVAALVQEAFEDRRIDPVETRAQIALEKPLRRLSVLPDIAPCRVAPTVGAAAV
jgi:hypothetical protein